jgi:uncharacterized protein (TIGR02231 family)
VQEKPIVQLEAPIVEVVLLEDRAQVLRRGKITLAAGVTRLEVGNVAPVLSDKTLAARVLPHTGVRVATIGAVRFGKALREERPGRMQELESTIGDARRSLETVTQQLAMLDSRTKSLDRIEELVLEELEQDAAWNRDVRAEAETSLDRNGKDFIAMHAERAALTIAKEEQERNVRDLEQRIAQVRSPATRMGAKIEADIQADIAGPCEIEFSYVVPGACWRPWHTAERVRDPKSRVLFRSEACVWQNTGEDWTGVALLFSTERPSLGIEPPRLESDVIEARTKAPVVRVQAREHTVQTTGLGAAAADTAELPGIDDGGDAIALRGTVNADIPSDGRPHRVPYGSFQADAAFELVVMPELSTSVIGKTEQTNASSLPLLAGPVDLLGDGGFAGRTQVRLVAPNERFALGWGPEAAVRVHRETEQTDQESGLMVNRVTTRYVVTVRLSNIGAEELAVKVVERVPVSEIEQVEITVDSEKTTESKAPDENGFLTWSVRLAPFGRQTLRLVYSVKRRKDVEGL